MEDENLPFAGAGTATGTATAKAAMDRIVATRVNFMLEVLEVGVVVVAGICAEETVWFGCEGMDRVVIKV